MLGDFREKWVGNHVALTNGTIDRKAAKISGTYSTIYTCPAGRVGKLDSLLISNLHATYDMQVWVGLEISGTIYELISGAKLSASTWEPGGRVPLVLETKQTLLAGDVIKAKIGAISQPSWVTSSQDAAIFLSIIEFSSQ